MQGPFSRFRRAWFRSRIPCIQAKMAFVDGPTVVLLSLVDGLAEMHAVARGFTRVSDGKGDFRPKPLQQHRHNALNVLYY